jgi:hypothetical protein
VSKSKRCYSPRKVFKNLSWENVPKEQAQILFNRVKKKLVKTCP